MKLPKYPKLLSTIVMMLRYLTEPSAYAYETFKWPIPDQNKQNTAIPQLVSLLAAVKTPLCW